MRALPNSKPAIIRLAQTLELLNERKPVNCSTLAERFEVSTKTAQRDIDFLRDRLGVDMEYNSRDHAYEVTTVPASVLAFLNLITPVQNESRRNAAKWMEAA